MLFKCCRKNQKEIIPINSYYFCPIILICDDLTTNRDIIEKIIRLHDPLAEILKFKNGKELINYIEKYKYRLIFKKIFLDVKMPLLDGYQVIDILENNNYLTDNVILTSAYYEPYKNYKILKKPFGIKEIGEILLS